MTTALIVALLANIQLSFLWSCFLAGSLRRANVISAVFIIAIGFLILVLFVLPIAGAPSIFDFNPARVAQQILRASDYQVVAFGILLGTLVPVVAVGIMVLVLRRDLGRLGPLSAAVLAVTLAGFTAAIIISSPAAGEPHLDISSVEMARVDLSDEMELPPGFVAKAYLPTGIRKITSIVIGPDDRLFVASQDGVIVAVDDLDGDGLGETIKFFGSKDGAILGLAISEDGRTIYVSGNGDIFRFQDDDLDGAADDRTRIIKGLPAFVYVNHSNNGLVIGPDKRFYMAQGGTSDEGPETHELGGTILTFNPDGTDLKVYARGLRNSYDLVFTSSGLLVATDNGPGEGSRGGPPDEINVIVPGGHYGYPDYFGDPPEGSGTIKPVYNLTSHVAPTGIVEYPSGRFPSKYHDKLFLALFMTNLPGSKVVQVDLDGVPPEVSATVEDFAEGFQTAIDVTVDSRGNLYVAGYVGGQVYQISYVGEVN